MSRPMSPCYPRKETQIRNRDPKTRSESAPQTIETRDDAHIPAPSVDPMAAKELSFGAHRAGGVLLELFTEAVRKNAQPDQ